MNRSGQMIKVMVFLIVVVFVSALVLTLMKLDVLEENEANDVDILNADFIPYEREGKVEIPSIQFCRFIDEFFICTPQDTFAAGETIYFKTSVVSEADGELYLIENYRIINPNGEIISDIDPINDFHYRQDSVNVIERIDFNDHFTLRNPVAGEYQVEVVVKNPLLNKETSKIGRFVVQ